MREPILTVSDRRFVVKLMKTFGIKRLNIDYSDSNRKWPDIWLDYYNGIPRVTVTTEWERQDTHERRKRLVHEIVCHHILGLEHGKVGGYDFNTRPEFDSYSEIVYRSLI